MREIYLLSGLGADRRVFNFLELPSFKLNHVHWIEPRDNESIEGYAKRLLAQIPVARPTLIGLSFGGMMAIEIGKIIETEKIILISSAKTIGDIPASLRKLARFGIYKVIPPRLLKSVNPFTYWFFGTKAKKERDLLAAILRDTDETFFSWAIGKIAAWKNVTTLRNVTHIHGTNDKILPFMSADFEIKGGGHLMILDNGKEVSNIILEILGRA
ncbi:MAG: alpha/beta hydrolase [Chryseolinea sp.]